jgi:hypothetical protein
LDKATTTTTTNILKMKVCTAETKPAKAIAAHVWQP